MKIFWFLVMKYFIDKIDESKKHDIQNISTLNNILHLITIGHESLFIEFWVDTQKGLYLNGLFVLYFYYIIVLNFRGYDCIFNTTRT